MKVNVKDVFSSLDNQPIEATTLEREILMFIYIFSIRKISTKSETVNFIYNHSDSPEEFVRLCFIFGAMVKNAPVIFANMDADVLFIKSLATYYSDNSDFELILLDEADGILSEISDAIRHYGGEDVPSVSLLDLLDVIQSFADKDKTKEFYMSAYHIAMNLNSKMIGVCLPSEP